MIIFQRIYIKGQQVHERILNITVIKEMQIKASMITSGLIWKYACMHAKLLQSCLTLCDPMNCSPPGSSVHGILQAGILEWVDMLSSRGSSQLKDWTYISYVSHMAITKATRDNKLWHGCEWKGILVHCWWYYKLVQPLWETIWRDIKKLKAELSWKKSESCWVVSDSLKPHGQYSLWNSPGQNTSGVHLPKTGIFPTQGSNPGLPHCRQVLYQLSHRETPIWFSNFISETKTLTWKDICPPPCSWQHCLQYPRHGNKLKCLLIKEWIKTLLLGLLAKIKCKNG